MLGLQYWMVPIFSGCVWLGMLLGMFLWWVIDTHKACIYPQSCNRGGHIPYISDIGAHKLQPLFIAGGTVTVVSFNFVFLLERWFRHKGRLVRNDSRSQKILSICSIIAAFIGGIGLILLTCFNNISFPVVHDVCLVIFIAGYIISAIFICAEYQRLGIHHREHRHLRSSFWIKLAFIFVEFGLAIAFGVLNIKEHYKSAAICEWLVSLIYTFYVWSFAIDFFPMQIYKDGFGKEHEESRIGMAESQEQASRNSGYAGGLAQQGVTPNEERVANGGRVVNGVHYPVMNPYTSVTAPSQNF